MNIGILGGSFNPPHLGHVLIAIQSLEQFSLDEIRLMPAFEHPFEKEIIPANHRLEMARLIKIKNVKVSDFEIKRKKTSFTIETLEGLNKRYPKDNFIWIMGSDQLKDFRKWKDWKKLVSKHRFIIFPRPGVSEKINDYIKTTLNIKKLPEKWLIAKDKNTIQIEISSTQIRDRIKDGRSIKYMVPAKIERYIKINKLYG